MPRAQQKYKVRRGDVVIALENNPINSLEDLTMLIGALHKPFQITFGRPVESKELPGSKSQYLIWAYWRPLTEPHSIAKDLSLPLFYLMQKRRRGERPWRRRQLSEREHGLRKVESSAKNKGKDVKRSDLQSRDDRPTYDHSEAASHQNAETARMVAAAKAGESGL